MLRIFSIDQLADSAMRTFVRSCIYWLPNQFGLPFIAILLSTWPVGGSYAVEIVWTDTATDQVLRAPADGNGPIIEVYGGMDYDGDTKAIFGVAAVSNRVYWADNATDQILTGPLDGSGPIDELYSVVSPYGLALSDNYIYWSDNATDQILRGSTDGTAEVVEIYSRTDCPDECAAPRHLRIQEGFLYWADVSKDQILRGPLDGTGPVVEIVGESDFPGSPVLQMNPLGLAVDSEFVYWANNWGQNAPENDGILRAPRDGAGTATFLYDIIDYPDETLTDISPRGIAIHGDYLFWGDGVTDQILMAPADGSGPITVLYDNVGNNPNYLYILIPEPTSLLICCTGLVTLGLKRCRSKLRA